MFLKQTIVKLILYVRRSPKDQAPVIHNGSNLMVYLLKLFFPPLFYSLQPLTSTPWVCVMNKLPGGKPLSGTVIGETHARTESIMAFLFGTI